MYPVGQMQDSIDLATSPLTSDPSTASTAVSMVMFEILKWRMTRNSSLTVM